MCKSAYYSIKAFRHIRPVFTCDMARAVAASLTQTGLDFANSLLIGTSGSNINKIQLVQTALLEWYFKIITIQLPPSYQNSTGFQSISELISYQSLTFGQPTYLSAVLTPHQPQRSLRSVNQNLLCVPRCNSSFGQRSFS